MLIFFVSLLVGFVTSTIVLGDLVLERFKNVYHRFLEFEEKAAANLHETRVALLSGRPRFRTIVWIGSQGLTMAFSTPNYRAHQTACSVSYAAIMLIAAAAFAYVTAS
jgi:hypothetical protein